jgi:hypothetical protein
MGMRYSSNKISPGVMGAFVQVAVDTGETEVRLIVGATVLKRADVLDVQGGEGRVFLMG